MDPPACHPTSKRIQPSELYEWVRTKTPKSADAVFIGGNGFRAIGVIEALEQNLNRAILTANQVAFWQALALHEGSAAATVCDAAGLRSEWSTHRL
jgi:maleate isomerase